MPELVQDRTLQKADVVPNMSHARPTVDPGIPEVHISKEAESPIRSCERAKIVFTRLDNKIPLMSACGLVHQVERKAAVDRGRFGRPLRPERSMPRLVWGQLELVVPVAHYHARNIVTEFVPFTV